MDRRVAGAGKLVDVGVVDYVDDFGVQEGGIGRLRFGADWEGANLCLDL